MREWMTWLRGSVGGSERGESGESQGKCQGWGRWKRDVCQDDACERLQRALCLFLGHVPPCIVQERYDSPVSRC